MLICLSELFEIDLEKQTLCSAVGLHGAGGFRAQCGLVEGGLMFLGVYGNSIGWTEERIIAACYEYADAFQQHFGSLRCYDLRPTGFRPDNPPHLCEKLTCKAITFVYRHIKEKDGNIPVSR